MKSNPQKHKGGFALLVTSVLLMLVALLSLVSIEHTGGEAASSARARSTARTMHAAEGGMNLAMARLAVTPPVLTPIDISIGNVSVQSRSRDQSGPQTITQVGSGGGGQVYQVNITAVGPDGSSSEIEAKFGRTDSGGSSSGY
ncbi:MAG: hypothetical protein JRH19_24705 [Deltaproteobacteria bacterium]|nr:hypothetical protein [Deltaproteobacteria bacterium]